MSHFKVTSGTSMYGALKLNGATGYLINKNSDGEDTSFQLLYSTGMMSLSFDITPELKTFLEQQFPTKN